MKTIETKTGRTGMTIELVSDNTERRFNVILSYPDISDEDYLFPAMVREKKARRTYNLTK